MAALKRVLLLNPPWRAPILRDYYCTSVAKAGYLWPPIDLLAQSGHLQATGLEVGFIDAVASRLGFGSCLARIERFDPEAVVMLTSPLSAVEDAEMMRALRGRLIVVSGEEGFADPAGYLDRNPEIAAVTTDFTTDSAARFLAGGSPPFAGLWTRGCGAVRNGSAGEGPFRLPVPRHDLLDRAAYRMPFLSGEAFGSVLTDFGCTRRCRFCNSGAAGHRLREPSDLEPELDLLQRLGYRHVFIKDMSFGCSREHALEVCRRLSRRGMSWHAYSRADDLDPELLKEMASSGCRLLQIGMESGDPSLRRAYGKDLDDSVFDAAVDSCRAAGIRVGLHVVVGLPGENGLTLSSTRRRLRKLNPDYVSVNVATLRRGSAAERADTPALGPLPPGILRARTLLYLDAYLRPSWIWAAVWSNRHPKALASLVAIGWGLVKGILRWRSERLWIEGLRNGRSPSATRCDPAPSSRRRASGTPVS